MKRITDPTFKYVPANATDIRRTFARIRRQLAKDQAEAACKVKQIKEAKR